MWSRLSTFSSEKKRMTGYSCVRKSAGEQCSLWVGTCHEARTRITGHIVGFLQAAYLQTHQLSPEDSSTADIDVNPVVWHTRSQWNPNVPLLWALFLFSGNFRHRIYETKELYASCIHSTCIWSEIFILLFFVPATIKQQVTGFRLSGFAHWITNLPTTHHKRFWLTVMRYLITKV